MLVIDALNKAVELHQNGMLREAENLYNEVLKVEPNNLDALYLLGIASYQGKKLDKAELLLRKALEIKPLPDIYKALADVSVDKGSFEQAIMMYQSAVSLDPEYYEGYYKLALIFHKLDQPDEALVYYERALVGMQDSAEIYNNIASILSTKGKIIEAINYYKKSLYFNPENFNAYFNLGNLYRSIKEYKQAIECFHKNIELNPSDSEAYYCIGVNHLLDKKYPEALEYLKKALDMNYKKDDSYFNIGNVYFERDDFVKADEYYRLALKYNARHALAWNNIVIIHKFKNELPEAIKYYKKSLEIAPDALQTVYNLGRALVANGQFEEGWNYFGVRDELYDNLNRGNDSLFKKGWKDNIEGKTIYVSLSGGYGDAITFIRYLPLLVERGANVITKYQPALVKLFNNCDFKAKVVDYNTPESEISYDARICNICLPAYFRSDFETMPDRGGYLKASKDRVEYYKNKYFNNNDFKVGFVWVSGTKSEKKFDNRTMHLNMFSKLFDIKGIKFYSLHKGERMEEFEPFKERENIVNIGESFEDFNDTAAAIENLDLVIGVDTAVTNLSGALGKNTWIILPYIGDWKWMLVSDQAIWYKDTRLFRVNNPDNPQEVFDRVYDELERLVDKE